jgi:flavin reductase (DIM6/NTAB) family NADH-FMN oxidoreductase RutF
MDHGQIHDEHPFTAPPDQRDPVRQLRGRLAVPVTILTAGDEKSRTGLTVSSLVVAEGDPALVYCLVGPTTDLLDDVEETERFVVHVCDQAQREASDVFAGLRPSPGGLFAGRAFTDSPYGPVLDGFGSYAMCTLVEAREESFTVLVAGRIDEVVLDDLGDPLVYFRGAYRHLRT